MTGRRIETFEYQDRRYRLFDGAKFTPANDENAAQFTCSASEIGGELEDLELEGESAECVAQQLGLFTIDGDAFFLLGCAGAHVQADGHAMGTVIETTTKRMSRNLAGTLPGLVALATVARLRPNVAIVRARMGQDGRAEVSRG